ncbi:MAG: serine/threonine-protein phosphatase [Lachnospiraceae bacterium]|jgi:serine/threonine protein phosphatase PrpC|nr:serine/threonine-protein phosphatase [Lachnospiraceae bacterium]MCH4063491.1 serine/threonine-protein phosphatase [Lachnospiraceae bacterium]MCH4104639.1 serine/threonine-protein phosphatase [Lachnospiraceae bacterium]MCI1310358.1 serine/threonine-protein phosphatase [Lachnospiraceae bacterium]MCI1334797.1 serine/threonine-protein phosphatase [Lachnospiraceae bacterium]
MIEFMYRKLGSGDSNEGKGLQAREGGMHFETAYINERGRRPGNQDSLVLMAAETRIGPVLLAGIFDGMGGLEKGELASGEVARAFDTWFLRELPDIFEKCGKRLRDEAVFESWERLVETQNRRLLSGAQRQGICLGTTAAALLITEKRRLVMHVGDSRVYEMDAVENVGGCLSLLTRDHTLAQRAVELGELEEEEAGRDPRSHVLTRCIGASEDVRPEFSAGHVLPGTVFLLCSDGFRNRISVKEMQEALLPCDLDAGLSHLQKMAFARGETDNMTAVAVRVCM